MRVACNHMTKLLHRFQMAERGSAAVEFALILPIMLLVYVGAIEASTLITKDRKVQSVAGAVGDLVARSNGTIPLATMEDIFQASGGIMTPYPVNDLKQVVTLVWVEEDGDTEIKWSQQFVNDKQSVSQDYVAPKPFTLPKEMIEIAKGAYVVVAEASYTHIPLNGLVYDGPIRLYRQNFFMPRFGGDIKIQ